jgi:hypothetical protein
MKLKLGWSGREETSRTSPRLCQFRRFRPASARGEKSFFSISSSNSGASFIQSKESSNFIRLRCFANHFIVLVAHFGRFSEQHRPTNSNSHRLCFFDSWGIDFRLKIQAQTAGSDPETRVGGENHVNVR